MSIHRTMNNPPQFNQNLERLPMLQSFVKGPFHLTLCAGRNSAHSYAWHRENWNSWLNRDKRFWAVLRFLDPISLEEFDIGCSDREKWVCENKHQLQDLLLGLIIITPPHLAYVFPTQYSAFHGVKVNHYSSANDAITYMTQLNLQKNGKPFNLESIPELFCDL